MTWVRLWHFETQHEIISLRQLPRTFRLCPPMSRGTSLVTSMVRKNRHTTGAQTRLQIYSFETSSPKSGTNPQSAASKRPPQVFTLTSSRPQGCSQPSRLAADLSSLAASKGSPYRTRRENGVGALSLGECQVTIKPPSGSPILYLRYSLVISTFSVLSMSTVPSSKAKGTSFRIYSPM